MNAFGDQGLYSGCLDGPVRVKKEFIAYGGLWLGGSRQLRHVLLQELIQDAPPKAAVGRYVVPGATHEMNVREVIKCEVRKDLPQDLGAQRIHLRIELQMEVLVANSTLALLLLDNTMCIDHTITVHRLSVRHSAMPC